MKIKYIVWYYCTCIGVELLLNFFLFLDMCNMKFSESEVCRINKCLTGRKRSIIIIVIQFGEIASLVYIYV